MKHTIEQVDAAIRIIIPSVINFEKHVDRGTRMTMCAMEIFKYPEKFLDYDSFLATNIIRDAFVELSEVGWMTFAEK